MTLTPEFIALQEALIGRYSLERELGRGGMGVVYLARDVRLDRPVAIKVMHATLAARKDARERFLNEARTAARLAHPHIIPIYSVETKNELTFLVMALVDGETLGSRLRTRGALLADDAERVLREMAWALDYAHARGVVHRDITLENVLIERHTGRALLVDFGLAGEHDGNASGPKFGTLGYLAPEVIRGEAALPQSDLYALGVVVWTALAGRAPLEADTPAQLLAKHLVQEPRPLGPLARGASRRLIEAVESCLAKDPDGRPSGAAALLAMLERAPELVAIAPALREWFTRWERIRQIYSIATPLIVLPFCGLIWEATRIGGSGWKLLTVGPLLVLTTIPFNIQIWWETAQLRVLYAKGFLVDDIRSAFPHWRKQLEQDRRREGIPQLPGRVIFDLTVIGVFLLTILTVGYRLVGGWFINDPGLADYFRDAIRVTMAQIGLPTLLGISIGFASPGYRLKPGGTVRRWIERFWSTPIAGILARVAVIGQRRGISATRTLHRNTELVIGLAVDDLWRAIPESLREGLGDVPGLTHMLKRSAEELRDLIERLRTSENDLVGDEENLAPLIAARTALEFRHKEAVASLERIRLQLLRLIATREHTSELTQQLSLARKLENSLLSELASHNEVRRLLNRARPLRAGFQATPTPTPA